jgi:hypothetical protein
MIITSNFMSAVTYIFRRALNFGSMLYFRFKGRYLFVEKLSKSNLIVLYRRWTASVV